MRTSLEALAADAYPRMAATLIRVTGDWTLAEDCAQEALAAAVQRWPQEGEPDNPGGWLMTVTRNRAIDALRRAQRRAPQARGGGDARADRSGGGRREGGGRG